MKGGRWYRVKLNLTPVVLISINTYIIIKIRFSGRCHSQENGNVGISPIHQANTMGCISWPKLVRALRMLSNLLSPSWNSYKCAKINDSKLGEVSLLLASIRGYCIRKSFGHLGLRTLIVWPTNIPSVISQAVRYIAGEFTLASWSANVSYIIFT